MPRSGVVGGHKRRGLKRGAQNIPGFRQEKSSCFSVNNRCTWRFEIDTPNDHNGVTNRGGVD